jgi:hypothetical protein
MDREAIAELLGEETIIFDGLDDAIIGHGQSYGNCQDVLVYSYSKMVDIFMERDGMDYEGACEWIDFNITCLHAGPHTPIVVLDILCD